MCVSRISFEFTTTSQLLVFFKKSQFPGWTQLEFLWDGRAIVIVVRQIWTLQNHLFVCFAVTVGQIAIKFGKYIQYKGNLHMLAL